MLRIVLLRLFESYFRHPILNLLPILLAAIAGGAAVLTRTPEYVTSGRLYVERDSLLAALTSQGTNGTWWVSGAQATTTEITELMGTRAFVRSAIAKTKLEAGMSGGPQAVDETIDYFRRSVAIQPVGEKLVDFTATSDDPELAHQIVVATMNAYVEWKINSDYQESVAARTFFDGLIQPYQEAVDNARGDLLDFLDAYPEPVRGERGPEEQLELDRLQAALTQAEERLTNALENQENANLSLAESESVTRQTYLVLDQPIIPSEPEVSLRAIAQDMLIFLAVGIFLSIIGIIGGALLDRTYRFPIDVRNGLSLPVLAMVPNSQRRAVKGAAQNVTQLGSQAADSKVTSAVGTSQTGD